MADLPLEDLDPTSDRAVFRQIADQLREAIRRGTFPEGEKVPSEAKLMEHYGVARMTVRQALQVLQSEGLVIAQHGRGVFVRNRPPVRRLASDRFARQHRTRGKAAFIAETEQAGGKPTVDSIRIEEIEAPEDVAGRLEMEKPELVIVRRNVHGLTGCMPLSVTRREDPEHRRF